MSGSYAPQQAMAARLIGKKGGDALLSRRLPGLFDPVTQVEVAGEVVAATFKCVALPPGRSAELKVGSLIGRKIVQFWFSQQGQTIVPQPGDMVNWAGQDFVVIWTTTYDPAGDTPIVTEAYAE